MKPPCEESSMSTLTRPRPRVKSSKPEPVVSLALAIDHQVYMVTPIRAQDPEILRGFPLEKKSDQSIYDVATHRSHGHECTCPDFEVRHRGIDNSGCKHIKALVKLGLLDAPAPVHVSTPLAAVV